MNESDRIKTMVLGELVWGGYHCAVTEFKYADVYAITKAMYSHEFEIKTNRADLVRELKIIEEAMKAPNNMAWGFGKNKHKKHFSYLKNIQRKDYYGENYLQIPNKFSFVVPEKLIVIAMPYLRNTPYGLYRYFFKDDWGRMTNIKKAKLLNKDTIKQKQFMYLLRKASTEMLIIRRKNEKNETAVTEGHKASGKMIDIESDLRVLGHELARIMI